MKKILALGIIFFCFLCAGCGFHFRSKSELPLQLRQFYFASKRPNNPLSIQLKELFVSMGIQLVKQPSATHYSVLVKRDSFSFTHPDIVDVSLPMGISYLQSTTIAIRDNTTMKIVASNDFQTTQTQTLNANQIFTSTANNLVQTQLSREMTTLIYYWLISSNVRDAIHHAVKPKTT